MTKHNVIWYSFALLFLCILVLTISVSGQEIKVSPEVIKIDLKGGEENTTILTVTWTGKDAILCNISTNITSDCPGNASEGINVTYSEDPVNLSPNTPKTVEMTIKVAPNLMPGVYTITTNFSCTAEEEPQPPSPPSPGSPGPPSDVPPVADASAGESYTGYVGEEITFDGSLSYDDGYIKSWYWDFGDGTNGTGETTTHSYSDPGIYNVTLTVKDDQGYTNTYETTAFITQSNRPPSTPEIDGPTKGSKNIVYNFSATSVDLDNNSIEYTFDWDDGNTSISDFLPNGTMYTVTHSWALAGIYTITVTAYDNETYSGTAQLTVLIDVHYVKHIGYLIDVNADGVYDLFYSNATGNETAVELQDNGMYLIDGIYEYDPETGVLALYVPSPVEDDGLICYVLLAIAIVAVAISILIHMIFFKEKKKKKKKKKGKKKKQ